MSEDLLVDHGDVNAEDPGTGRRGLLGKAAIAAAVAAVTGVSMSKAAEAGVGNGPALNQGAANTGATITTSLAGGSTFLVADGSTAGPTGGVNPRVGSMFGTQSISSRAGIMGEATGTGYGWAVYGRNTSSQGIGVYGLNVGTAGVGLYGEHRANTTELGTGVVGISNSGVGVYARGGTYDFQADGGGRVNMSKAGVANPPAGASVIGTLARDAAGNLWYCSTSGTPGAWRTLGGPGSAGAFHALTPGRVFDSRVAAPATGALTAGGSKLVSVAAKRDLVTGAIVVGSENFVPAGATAISANITVVNTVGSGFLAANPGGTVVVSAATINWYGPGQILNNGVIVTLNTNRELTVVAGGAGGASTDFVIDVTGYFL